jgi:hypothetical protein
MNLEQYTDDAVCFAMGIGRFVPTGVRDAIRLVCCPSFTPEFSVTLIPGEIVIVALKAMLWPEPIVGRMPEISERASLTPGEYEKIESAFERALAESRLPPKLVLVCDGMRASAVRVHGGTVEQYTGNAVNQEEQEFAKGVLALALSKAQSADLRDRIQGRPIKADSMRSPENLCRLLVLGEPDARSEFHALFHAKAEHRPIE